MSSPLDHRLANPAHSLDIHDFVSRFHWADISYIVKGAARVADGGALPRKLRGALGQAMLAASCNNCRNEKPCQRNPLCAVNVFFGSKPRLTFPWSTAEITKPYIIVVQDNGNNDLKVTMRLFGFSVEWARALQLLMGDILLQRIPWKQLVPAASFLPMKTEIASRSIQTFCGLETGKPQFPVELEFTSPENAEKGNPFESLESLCKRLVARAALLARWHDCNLEFDLESLKANWESVDYKGDRHPNTSSLLRYSHRTGQNWSTDVKLGTVRIEAQLSEMWPYFKLAELTAVGRGATIGLGQFKLFC